jgi:hypothetical protein
VRGLPRFVVFLTIGRERVKGWMSMETAVAILAVTLLVALLVIDRLSHH